MANRRILLRGMSSPAMKLLTRSLLLISQLRIAGRRTSRILPRDSDLDIDFYIQYRRPCARASGFLAQHMPVHGLSTFARNNGPCARC